MKNFRPVIIYIDLCLLLFCSMFLLNKYDKTSVDTLNTAKDSTGNNIASSGEIDPNAPKKIALTFDDGPHSKNTPKLLDGLKARNVKATFFVIGQNAEQNPEILKRMHDEGHLIGNHSYSHAQLSCIQKDKALEEITKTSQIIYDATGYTPKYIRPPYGGLCDVIREEHDLTVIMWTIDPRDWSVLNTNAVVKHVVSHAKNNDIILLHDIFDTSVEAAFQIVDQLQAKGFTFVTVDEFY